MVEVELDTPPARVVLVDLLEESPPKRRKVQPAPRQLLCPRCREELSTGAGCQLCSAAGYGDAGLSACYSQDAS